MDLIILLLNLFAHEKHENDIKIYLGELIDRLCSYDVFQYEGTPEMT